ncbi:MAG TPA: Tm-1-like ATP-binding domain-containing protein [Chloroflexota bacterium]|nr:Tm-1-like ATP-binding domain-containing protein [Chloroflexota bacterium]
MAKIVVVIAALDTKGEEAKLIRDTLAAQGVQPLVVDVGVLGVQTIPSDVSRAEVAAAGGGNLDQLVAGRDKALAMEVMPRGAALVAARLYSEGRLDGIIGLGGSAGTAIATSAMRALPVGVPKLVVSTVAAGDTRAYIGTKDVTMMYSVVDIAGINRLSARILSNAAAGIAGMVKAEPPTLAERPLLAASMFGNTTPCVDRARENMEAAGYEVLVFHATGAGGQTMESLIADGYVDGVLDLTTTEWADELAGGVFSAGPGRLDAAARAGIPQVIAPGCLDMVNFGAPETVPERYRQRKFYRWNPNVTLMRTTPKENAQLGQIIAEKANAAKAAIAIMLPLGGVSQLDSAGGDFWWPEADAALFAALKAHVRPGIPVIEMPENINDPAFADRAAGLLLAMVRKGSVRAPQ